MSKQAGFEGTVKIGNAELDLTVDASLSINNALVEVTARDSGGYRERIGGIKEWALTLNVRFKEGDSVLATIRTAKLAGTKLSNVKFIYKGGEGFKGDAFVESCDLGQPFEDADTWDITLQGTGVVSFVASLT